MTTLEQAMASGRGVERPFNCPNPDHDDHTASASVNVALELWLCYACGAAGRAGAGSITQAMKAVIEQMKAPLTTATLSEGWLDVFDGYQTSPYWASRVGPATAELFRCGTHPFLGTPTYPVRDPHGRVLGVVQRTPATPKYLYPAGVNVSRCLFGYERTRRAGVLLVTEGAGDAMAVYAAAGHGFVQPVGAYGCGLHAPQLDLITARAPAHVVVAFDNDDAGRRGTATALAQLRDKDIAASAFHYPAEVKDFGEMSHAQIRKELSAYGRLGGTTVRVA